ncbi:uncharacterized protein RCC_06905 [Ramularia collo-cygni]|uniref:Protein phosphatase 4 core regulatory subunit R2 n=1 Tax=Ramularia collo-cygni TaxID=112498 RepID=A0A2D3VDZ6_9PEZI|nr:uncharacterized protein RCC_06905 [Ramularia collo-cygni]CZT21044.1 uncharacterized protein RCC_06905 [Ramularia collo-cygni]
MDSSEDILETAARDGSLDIADWPRVLESLLKRLHDIVHNEFPIPTLPHPATQPPPIDPQVVASTPPRLPKSDTDATESEASNNGLIASQNSAKENEAPTDIAAGRAPPATSTTTFDAVESQLTERDSQADGVQAPPGTLPPDLLSSYQMSRRILEHDFSESPPYTIQRLAELVLRPKAHYRHLNAYLRALDRVVSVCSPVSNFPLPTMQVSTNPGFLTNGTPQTNGITERDSLGSDESLGGALLTPIPWLATNGNALTPASATSGTDGELHSESTETIDGPHGAGSIETVSVTVNGIASTTNNSAYTSSSPIASPTLSEQSDASSSSESSMEAQLREQGAITQGELLRQEQEAGVVAVGPNGAALAPRRTLISGGAAAVGRDVAAVAAVAMPLEVPMDEEQPHARGPDVIGMEDMGPQRQNIEAGNAVLDMEAAVGRGRSKSPQPPSSDEAMNSKQDGMEGIEPGKPGLDFKDVEKDVEMLRENMDKADKVNLKDSDGDVMLADVDGKEVGAKAETGGEANTEEDVELKAK